MTQFRNVERNLELNGNVVVEQNPSLKKTESKSFNMKAAVLKTAAFIVVAAWSISSFAQPRAIGLRGGYYYEASYQHSFGEKMFLELDLGTSLGVDGKKHFSSISLTPTLNFSIAKPNWTSKGEWEFYAGPSITIGQHFGYKLLGQRAGNHTFFGLGGMFGLSYTFWFPLQLSVDVRPVVIGINTLKHYKDDGTEKNISVYSDFFSPYKHADWNFQPSFIAFSARFSFGK